MNFVDKIQESKWFNIIMVPVNLFWILSFFSLVVPVLWYSNLPGIVTILVSIIIMDDFISSFVNYLNKCLEK